MNPYHDPKTGEFTHAPSSVLGRGHATLAEATASVARQNDAIQRAASMSGKMPALRHAPVAVQVGNRYHVVTSGEAKKYSLPEVRNIHPALAGIDPALAKQKATVGDFGRGAKQFSSRTTLNAMPKSTNLDRTLADLKPGYSTPRQTTGKVSTWFEKAGNGSEVRLMRETKTKGGSLSEVVKRIPGASLPNRRP